MLQVVISLKTNASQMSKRSVSLNNPADLAIGDHLVSKRKLYTHHGIYIGDNRVIHYSGLAQGLQSGPVVISDLKEFLCGHTYQLRKYDSKKFTPTEIRARALNRLGESLYHPLFNNCEHFAEWCVCKRHTSRQVDVLLTMVAGLPGYIISKTGSRFAKFISKTNKGT